MNKWLTSLFFVGFLGTQGWAADAPGNILVGKAVHVHSGDTFVVSVEDKAVKVRLQEVDAPEENQPFGPQSRRYLEKMIIGRALRIDVAFIDRFGRRVGRVTLAGGRVVNDEMVGEGYAWHYRATPKPDKHLMELERNAFSHSLGLWMQKHPVPPWEFRREKIIPKAPMRMEDVDYDNVLHTGILGDRATQTYTWPACREYLSRKIKKPVVFLSLHQAAISGFRKAGDCP